MALERTEDFTPALAAELAALHPALDPDDRTVFHDPHFLLACWRSAPPEARPFALLRRGPGGAIEGAAFFKHDTVRVAGRRQPCIVPITARVTDFTPFLAPPAVKADFIGQVLAELEAQPLPAMLLLLRPAESREVEARAARGGWTPDAEVVNPVVLARDLPFAKIVSKKSLRVATNQLGRRGRLEITHQTSGVSPEQVDELRELHRERWAFDGSDSKLAEPFFRTLYHALARDYPAQAAEGCGLVYSAARLDGEPVAVHLGFQWGTTFLYHLPATNLAYLDASPGQVLLRSLFERAAAEGIECFDLGFGVDPYKDRYATEQRVYRTWVYLPSTADRLRQRARRAAAALVPARAAERLRGAGTHPVRLLRSAWKAVRPRRVLVLRKPGATEVEIAPDLVELTFADAVRLSRGPKPFPFVLRRRLLERYREGYRFFALRKDGELVSFIWAVITTELYASEADAMLRDAGPALWFTDAVTPEAHRGRGYYPELLRAVIDAMPAPTVVLYVRPTNARSRSGLAKAGFTAAAEIVTIGGIPRLRARTELGRGLKVRRRESAPASPPGAQSSGEEAAGAKAAGERQATAGAGGRS